MILKWENKVIQKWKINDTKIKYKKMIQKNKKGYKDEKIKWYKDKKNKIKNQKIKWYKK